MKHFEERFSYPWPLENMFVVSIIVVTVRSHTMLVGLIVSVPSVGRVWKFGALSLLS